MSEAFDKRLQELLADNVRGSRAIAADAASLIGELLNNQASPDVELLEDIRDASARIKKAHTSLIVVQKLCVAVESALDGVEDSVSERLTAVLEHWRDDRFETAIAAMAEHLMPVLKPGCRFLCHSHSSTVLGVLKHAHNTLKNLRIIQTVSYPMKEGVRSSEELADAEIDVRLIADAGAASAVGECDLVLLGADSIHKSGVVNKLGSFGIALAAKHFGVPVYAVADSTKFVSGDSVPEFEQHNPAELADLQHPRFEVDNIYFDITPLELIAGIVTEEGLFTPDELRIIN